MEDILRQLFNGDYSAYDDIMVIPEAMRPEQHRQGDISTHFKSVMSTEEFKLLQELLDSMNRMQNEDLVKAYKAGVRLGARFVIESCLIDSDETLIRQEKEVGE